MNSDPITLIIGTIWNPDTEPDSISFEEADRRVEELAETLGLSERQVSAVLSGWQKLSDHEGEYDIGDLTDDEYYALSWVGKLLERYVQ